MVIRFSYSWIPVQYQYLSLSKWMESDRSNRMTCPTCKGAISKDKIIPIYARGRPEKDPRKEASRPAPQRAEATQTAGRNSQHNAFNNMQFSAGFGMFGLFPGFGFTFVSAAVRDYAVRSRPHRISEILKMNEGIRIKKRIHSTEHNH